MPAAQPIVPDPDPLRRTALPATARKRLLADRAAKWMVTAGGLTIVACILGILVFIVVEVQPLFERARVTIGAPMDLPFDSAGAIVADEYRSHLAALDRDGGIHVIDLETGQAVLDRPLFGEGTAGVRLVGAAAAPGQSLLVAATEDGRVAAQEVTWSTAFESGKRVVTPGLPAPVVFEIDPRRGPVKAFAARVGGDGTATAAAWIEGGPLVLVRRDVQQALFNDETTEIWTRSEARSPSAPTRLVLDTDQRNLYAGTGTGELIWWPIVDGKPGAPRIMDSGSEVTALTLLIGDRSLVSGHADGTIRVWFPLRGTGGAADVPALARVRDFPRRSAAVRALAPSLRDKGFLALDAGGGLDLLHSTAHSVFWSGRAPVADLDTLSFAPKADGAFVAGGNRLVQLDIDNPHPQVSLRALFGRVWYEGHDRPEYVWQSSSGTDDFEPKLSLTPLLFGTLKGTAWALILAIPLGVLGAMYTSQLMHPSLKRWVKPTVEIMAALPSVVLGFLAGLWLAPRVDKILPAMLLMLFVLPLAVVSAGFAGRALPASVSRRMRPGAEVLTYALVLLAAGALCLALGRPFEALLFGGDFHAWLVDTLGLRYDQHNAVVVGLAMGFAVIPIIFSISEDAFSNVPRSLVSGSLALGADRWQTVTRVVLPTASPGIFSAIMIGFGRAVGETMIVLMATGNTPIMDWNPFNGFRTLSANIATEIPEAPHGGTLYRVLFLAALLLFILTFVVNTAAELVRQRLRRRYSSL